MPQTTYTAKNKRSYTRRSLAYEFALLIAQSQGVPTPKPRDVSSGQAFDKWLANVIEKFNDEIEIMK